MFANTVVQSVPFALSVGVSSGSVAGRVAVPPCFEVPNRSAPPVIVSKGVLG